MKCLKYILKIHSSNKTTSGHACAGDASWPGPELTHLTVPPAPRAPGSLGRAVPWRRAAGEGRELTAGVEDPCPLSVVAGGVEDESVVVEEGSGALGPQDHDGHVFQVWGARQRIWGEGLAHCRCSDNGSIPCYPGGRGRWELLS